MRILIVSSLYPPVAFGGYEVECSAVAEHLSERNAVLVLTSDRDRASVARREDVRRELAALTPDWRGALRAPPASLRAVASARRALAWGPELIYVWNGASIPQASLRVLADSGVPLAFRICEHWFGGLFLADQFMRELLPARRRPLRAAWAAGRARSTRCRRCGWSPPSRCGRRSPGTPRRSGGWSRCRASCSRCWSGWAIRYPATASSTSRSYASRRPEPQIVVLGRVTPYKGLSVAIEALALLRSAHSIHARLLVLGPEDPEHGADMRRLAERLGVGAAVVWRGQLDPPQVAAELARSHVLLVPSLWQEPFPLVTIEGALARVPLVAADVGGIGEGMHDEEHALLFARGDARAAAVAVARTLNEPEQTAARVARAHTRALGFRLEPYLQAQERFVLDARDALLPGRGPGGLG